MNKKNIATYALLTTMSLTTIVGTTKLYKNLDKKSNEQIQERYSHLIGKEYDEQKTYILNDLAQRSLGYRLPHPIGYSNEIKNYTARQIIKNLEKNNNIQ